MQTPQPLNIIQLIEKNSITRLSKDYENRLINKIKENFTESQQQMFLGTFYCLLNYDLKKDFVIDFDNVWKWLGFSRKDNAKRLLEKFFTLDIDYKVKKAAPLLGGAGLSEDSDEDETKNTGGAGLNKEQIMLNVKTFKKFCLKAGTKKADEIHDYYTGLEELLQETINEQTHELQEQIRIKNEENEEICEEMERLDEKMERLAEEKESIEEEKERLEEENDIIREEKEKLEKKYIKPPKIANDKKNVVYLMTTDDGEKRGEYAIGKAKDLSNRRENYNLNKIHDFKVVYYVSLPSTQLMDIIEAAVLMKLDKFRFKAWRDAFLLPDLSDIKLFTDVFDECVKFYGNTQRVVYAGRTDKADPEKLKEYRENYYEEHKEEILEKRKEYHELNSEPMNENKRILYSENPEIYAEKSKIHYEEHKEEIIAQVMEHYHENREVILEERKVFYQENKEVILEERKEYYDKNYETKIAPQRQALELCECGMTMSHYGMKKHKTSASHLRLMEKKNNPDVEDDASSRIKCECGMTLSKANRPRHTKSDRHKRLMQKLEEKTE